MTLSEFSRLFGNTPMTRVLDYFLDNQYLAFGQADVLRGANISYNTARPVWERLIAANALIPDGKTRKTQLYRLNKKNLFIQQLITLDHTISHEFSK